MSGVDLQLITLVKAGYGSWLEVNEFSAEEVLNMLEFESISLDIEYYQMEQAKAGN